ncbi:MAG: hypothetical protein ACHRXM_26425 [Isosphaerales bacterium]
MSILTAPAAPLRHNGTSLAAVPPGAVFIPPAEAWSPPEPFVEADRDAAAAAELLCDQEHKAKGWHRCRDCGSRPHPDDMEWFFHERLCTGCGMRLIDELLHKIARRHGRSRALKLLKQLAK